MHHWFDTHFLSLWVLALSVLAFSLFGYDKRQARRGGRRIRERTLFLTALLGGSPGAILGMRVFHHKTLHRSFRWGLPAILMAQIALCLWLFVWKGGHFHA